MNKIRQILIICFAISLQFSYADILIRQSRILGSIDKLFEKSHGTFNEAIHENLLDFVSEKDFLENIKESIEISAIFNSYSSHGDAIACGLMYLKTGELDAFIKKIENDNSLYFQRLGRSYIDMFIGNTSVEKVVDEINKRTGFERTYFLTMLRPMYSNSTNEKEKGKIASALVNMWERTEYSQDYFFIAISYPPIKKDTNGQFDNKINKDKRALSNYMSNQVPVSYFYFLYKMFTNFSAVVNEDFSQDEFINNELTVFPILKSDEKQKNEFLKSFSLAYDDLIKSKQLLDADFTFYWFRNAYNEQIINLARNHIKNPEFKDARYKTVYYLVNHDFDTSFPVLTNMVQNSELCYNEIKNFYRGLARLNKLSYSVLTPEQQQKANDYLKQQMLIEKDPSMKLYIDFLLSICIDDYSLSSERITLLNKFKDITGISDEDKKQIDRRLYIIKWTKLQHYPSVFYSYVNGLDDKKPFIDVTKTDIHKLPAYRAEANGEVWYYHDVNSEAYIARNKEQFKSLNLVVPSELDGYPVVGLALGSFSIDAGSFPTNIVLSNTIKIIDHMSFLENTNLVSLVIPNSVTNLKTSSFSKSTKISKIYLEEGSPLTDDNFYLRWGKGAGLRPECKIIRTKFENGLPVIPLENGVEEEPQLP